MNKNVVVVCLTTIVVSFIGVMGAALVAGGDFERIAMWGGSIIGPLIAAIATYVKLAKVHSNVLTVKHRTNGTLDQVFDRLRAVERRAGVEPPSAPGAAPAVIRDLREGPPIEPG